MSGEIFSIVEFSPTACLFTVSIGSAWSVGVFILFSTEELTDMDCLVLVLVALYTILLLLEKADIMLLLEMSSKLSPDPPFSFQTSFLHWRICPFGNLFS